MKKSKIIVPALGILVLSTAASITGTVAWFTAANSVEVNGFRMKAEAEEGIVIANESHSDATHWNLVATASHTGVVSTVQQSFVPTSTAGVKAGDPENINWFHANSGQFDNAEAGQADNKYSTHRIGATHTTDGTPYAITESDGIGSTTVGSSAKNIYLKNTFYIQSSLSAISGQDIFLENLAVTGNSSSPDLDKALRLMVVCGNQVTIFGCLTGYTASYKAGGATSGTAVSAVSGKQDIASNVEIPAYSVSASSIQIDTYLYFEGEDAECKSSNITATLDTLEISFHFGNEAHA